MKIRKIGFGYVKNLGGFENCRVYIEAELEDWEDPSQSLDILRTQIAKELDLPDKWIELRQKTSRQERALETANTAVAAAEEKLKKVQQKWEEFTQSLIACGLNPELVAVDPITAIRVREGIKNQIDIDAVTESLLPNLNQEPSYGANDSGDLGFGECDDTLGEGYENEISAEDDDSDFYFDSDAGDSDYAHLNDRDADLGESEEDCESWGSPDCGNENHWPGTPVRHDIATLPDFDSPNLVSEIDCIVIKDKQILEEFWPLLKGFTWQEKIAIGQTAYFFIAITAEDSLLKLIPVRGDGSFSKPLQQAMNLLEELSLEMLAEVATKILKEDIELRGDILEKKFKGEIEVENEN